MKAQKAQKIVLFFCHFSNMFLSYFRGLGKSLSRDTLEHKTPHPFSSSPSPPCSLIFRITSKKRLKFREVGYKAHICSPVKTFNNSRQDNQSNRC